MLQSLKNLGRAIIPASLFRVAQPYYHGSIALLASWYFHRPSQKMIVIGVTGTAGKSTTVSLLATILNHAGHKTGFITTANFFDGNQEFVNKHGLSMPGGFMLQQQLATMVKHGCQYAIVEATSEGLAQNRHLGIKFDVALLTTFAPAHLDAHKGLANYRAAKGKLFAALNEQDQRIIGINLDAPDANYFLQYPAQKKFGITLHNATAPNVSIYNATDLVTEPRIKFTLHGINFELPLIGQFNIYNTVMAVACADQLGIRLEQSAAALGNFRGVSGRMEIIPNNRQIQIFVDYAPEPLDMENSLQAVSRLPHGKIIHVFGATGGHRDKNKRFEFGGIAAKYADIIIITNDDVYDSDPEEIAQHIRQGIDQATNKKVTDILTTLDRRAAIHQALALAQPQDIVLITGKGSEQFLVLLHNQRIVWDEPTVVKEELQKL